MFLTARQRTIHRSRERRVCGDAICILATLYLSLLPSGGWAQTKDDFEQPPMVEAKELVPEKLLTGPGVRVENQVPTDGVMGTFTVHADEATYHDAAGTY